MVTGARMICRSDISKIATASCHGVCFTEWYPDRRIDRESKLFPPVPPNVYRPPFEPSLFFTAAAFFPRCARNYNKCRARNTRRRNITRLGNGVTVCRFLFFFFFANVFSPSNVSTPYAYDYIASRARCKVVSCSTRSRDRERERERSTRRRGSVEGGRGKGCESAWDTLEREGFPSDERRVKVLEGGQGSMSVRERSCTSSNRNRDAWFRSIVWLPARGPRCIKGEARPRVYDGATKEIRLEVSFESLCALFILSYSVSIDPFQSPFSLYWNLIKNLSRPIGIAVIIIVSISSHGSVFFDIRLEIFV